MSSRYSKALPPPPSDATPASVRTPLPTHFENATFRISDEPLRSPVVPSQPNPPAISMPTALRPSSSQRRPSQSSTTPRFSKISRIIRKPPPRVDSTSPKGTMNDAVPLEQPNAGSFLTRVKKKSSPPRPDVLSPEDASETASFSAYPGRMRDPASDRVPVPTLGEEAVSERSFLEETIVPAPNHAIRYPELDDIERGNMASLRRRPGVSSPVSGFGGEHPFTPQSPEPTPRKSRGAVRFKVAGMVALGVHKMTSGTANLARRTSLGSGSGSQPQSSARQTGASPRTIEEPLAHRLHAGPGGLFEPEPRDVHPAVRTLLERVASSSRPGGWNAHVESAPPSEAEETENVSPVSPQSARTTRNHTRNGDHRQGGPAGQAEYEEAEGTSPLSDRDVSSEQWERRRRRPYRRESYQDGETRLKDPRQGPSSISHEGPTTADLSHENTYESSRPLVRHKASSSSRAKPRTRGGYFQRNAVGMDIFAEPVIEESPSAAALLDGQTRNDWEAVASLKRVLNAFFYLPLRSKSHVTVSYIPARAKPDGSTTAEPWYTPKPPKLPKSPNAAHRPSMPLANETPRNRRRYRAGSNRRKKPSSIFAQPALKVIETDPSRRSRYITQDHMIAGQPIQILSEDAAPILIAPGGAPHLSHSQEAGSPHSAWFTQPTSP
jgi:hypothetical protein